jgi:hypothetical protein
MPRPHQYRVGSLVAVDSEKNVIEIENIEKLRNAPMTFAITFRELDNTEDLPVWQKKWCGAHQLNEMLDIGSAWVVSY